MFVNIIYSMMLRCRYCGPVALYQIQIPAQTVYVTYFKMSKVCGRCAYRLMLDMLGDPSKRVY